jgi:hypothetical protein
VTARTRLTFPRFVHQPVGHAGHGRMRSIVPDKQLFAATRVDGAKMNSSGEHECAY